MSSAQSLCVTFLELSLAFLMPPWVRVQVTRPAASAQEELGYSNETNLTFSWRVPVVSAGDVALADAEQEPHISLV